MKIGATIQWEKQPEEIFLDGYYSRIHQWSFDGGMKISASSSPSIVPIPMSDATLIDPEEAFLASISSCHMLFFLSFAVKKKYIINSYEDHPIGIMGKNNKGKLAMLSIILNPKISFEGNRMPSDINIAQMHNLAHSNCFIANSIHSKITIK